MSAFSMISDSSPSGLPRSLAVEWPGGRMGASASAASVRLNGEFVHVSRAAAGLAEGGLELLDAENLRPHCACTLWAWSQALQAQLDRARALTSEATVRAYRLYLAGCAMGFEQGWLSLYQMLAARPDGAVEGGAMRGAQSDYPFERRYMLALREPATSPAGVH